ncbi:MAG: hypothetical protein JW940_38670 [Polyangiaceae bacterium]|nr:hypothetical protein [Polyangiaceae bacterium]
MALIRCTALAAALLVPAAAAAQTTQYGQPSSPTDIQAGGLTPPDTMQRDTYSGPSQTEQELAAADREDSGRGLEFFWLNVEGGAEQVGLQTFTANHLVDAEFVETTHLGPLFGAGLGLRLMFLTIGPRFRLANFSSFALWTLDGEVGFHVPIGVVEPYVTLSGGYAALGSLDSANGVSGLNMGEVTISGWNVRGGVGLDLYLAPAVSIGANLTGEALILTRPGVTPQKLQSASSASTPSGAQQTAADIYAADGSSVGAGATLTGVIGLHF